MVNHQVASPRRNSVRYRLEVFELRGVPFAKCRIECREVQPQADRGEVGVAAVPAGIALSRLLFDQVGNIGGYDIPSAAYGVYVSWELMAIPLAGLVVAVAAAMIPGRWAARTNVVEALHAE